MKKVELLAPAGNIESFYQAINSGADAIYLAGKAFGARSYAPNFSNEQLQKIIQLGKIYGVKIYITMNTLVKENEVEEFLKQVEFLYKNGVDAIIMQDFGMICLCLEKYPNLEIHASTQFNSSSIETVELLHKLGVKRVVLPREMSLAQIKEIETKIEKEVFIHGALCVSYSGCCLMSQMLGGRSGNRGECAGSCRLFYQLYLGEEKQKEGYLLSMKDLNTSSDLKKIRKEVTSLKIEGRMKSPTYVSFVTKYYRNLIDGKKEDKKMEEALQSVFYRGFTKGHLLEDEKLINMENPNHIGLKIGNVIAITKNRIKIKLEKELKQNDGIRFLESKKGMIVNYLYDQKERLISKGNPGQVVMVDNKVELTTKDQVRLTMNSDLEKIIEPKITKKVPLKIIFHATIGKHWHLTFIDENKNKVTYDGSEVEQASTAPLSQERIKEQLMKLGNSPFICQQIEIDLDENVFLRIGDLNIARRTLVERLIGVRKNDKKDPIIKRIKPPKKHTKKEQINITTYYDIPRNLFHITPFLKEKSMIHEIIEIPNNKKIIGGTSLNVYNSYTAYYLSKIGYQGISLSTELTEQEQIELCEKINNIYGNIPIFIQIKGRVEVMIIKGNILGIKENIIYHLVDQKQNKFPVFYDGRLTHIESSYEIKRTKEKFKTENTFFLTK